MAYIPHESIAEGLTSTYMCMNGHTYTHTYIYTNMRAQAYRAELSHYKTELDDTKCELQLTEADLKSLTRAKVKKDSKSGRSEKTLDVQVGKESSQQVCLIHVCMSA